MNVKIKIGVDAKNNPIYDALGKWWLGHHMRRQYDTLIFAPGEIVPNSYNLWKGFGCESKPGNCELFLSHIKNIICANNEEYFNYLMCWMARAVQHPNSPGEVAIVMRGRMGTGKSFFAKEFGKLWGRHFLQVSDPKHLVGSFNSHLRDCIVLFGDEAFYAGDKKHESVLKTLITEEHITIEAKGIDVEAAPNYIHLILASNNNWVVPAGGDERRYFVLDVSDDKMQNKDYFAKLSQEMKNGGREALLNLLQSYDLKGFNTRAVPKTEALLEQKLLSMQPEEEWWYKKLQEGRILDSHFGWEIDVAKNSVLEDYLNYMKDIGILRRANSTLLGKFLQRACPGDYPRSIQKWVEVDEGGNNWHRNKTRIRPYYYQFPELEICRQHFEKSFGGAIKWQEIQIEDFNQPMLKEAF